MPLPPCAGAWPRRTTPLTASGSASSASPASSRGPEATLVDDVARRVTCRSVVRFMKPRSSVRGGPIGLLARVLLVVRKIGQDCPAQFGDCQLAELLVDDVAVWSEQQGERNRRRHLRVE